MSKALVDSCCQMEISLELLDLESLPTVTDLERNMGKKLVDVYLKTCTPIERTLLGRDKPLKGPGKLWINPEDRLGEETAQLTPLPTVKLQAMTHQEILRIGMKFEEKFEEQNRQTIAKAVAEAEELSNFETVQKIKFHVETETRKLNEEWHERFKELTEQHETEKKCLKKFYEDGRELLKQFIEKKCKLETDNLISQKIVETKHEMEERCSEAVERELAQQLLLFNEQMDNTITNLKVEDKNRIEEMSIQCVKAMDLQSHLMTIRQLSELMHMMTVEKFFWKAKIQNVKNDLKHECEGVNMSERLSVTRDHQSKSIKHLWDEFLHQLDGFDGEKLDEVEERVVCEIQQTRRKLIKESQGDDGSSLVDGKSAVQKSNEVKSNKPEIETSEMIDQNFIKSSVDSSIAPFFEVEWEKIEKTSNEIEAATAAAASAIDDDSFSYHVLKQFLQPQSMHLQQNPMHPEIASSIIANVIKKLKTSTELNENMTRMIHDVMLQELSSFNSTSQAVDFVPMPKTEVVNIKDSLEVITRRVSIPNDPQETDQLLAVTDSLELISWSAPTSKMTSASTAEWKDESDSEMNINLNDSLILPPYMKIPEKRCKNYARMTRVEWDDVKFPQIKSRRASSVQFIESQSSEKESRRKSSILRTSSLGKGNSVSHDQDALHPIQEKCREAFEGMKMKSVLMMLCDDKSNVTDDVKD